MRGSMALRSFVAGCLLVILLVSQSGCIGMTSTLMYWVHGNKVDARCTALNGKRVAVVCVSSANLDSKSDESAALARRVSMYLEQNVPKIKMIRPEEVADWRDQNTWNQVDYQSVGRGVKAEMVVAIDLSTFSIHGDATLLKGRASVKTTVFDMTDKGKVVFSDGPQEYVFPENGAQHVVENETNFKRIYLKKLSEHVSRNFFAYDKMEDFAPETILH